MSEINSSNFKKEHGDLAPDLVGVTELTSPYFFVPPSGTTAERPEDCEPGTLRFNTDQGSLEIFRGKTIGWEQIQRRDSQYLGGGTGSNAGTGTRGLALGGYNGGSPGYTATMDFFTIEILGNAQDFGDLLSQKTGQGGNADSTRGVITGGHPASSPYPATDEMQFIAIASLGDAVDFANLNTSMVGHYSGNDKTRGIVGASESSNSNVIEHYTIQSLGNTVDFGDRASGQYKYATGSVASTTRGLIMGGYDVPTAGTVNNIDFLTIQTLGNTQEFGDMTQTGSSQGTASNATRAIRMGRYPTNNVIDFVTIATEGNAIDFGDMAVLNEYDGRSCANRTRYVHQGGSSTDNVMQFVEIATTGNTQDFGDLVVGRRGHASISNGHGGL